ncbi:hypothetical protein [Actinophytocola algeriensis]|uniref:Putative acyltransferase n=1 Tax=Actinophytocola algeriensis TaxID=1768010 RepID=A0A7W7VHL0_9PSEU|nr:hypothetical protein [Actinophytocola algeriensis]MBB4910543.1 putative acyltransferase [Actinophytocola algeriensis]MBE1480468.1 putative acyltransferase [Actinophytocola algeriensis]
MPVWTADTENAVRRALGEVTYAEPGREHLGLPYITAYQLAIKVRRIDPSVAPELEVGGEGIGQRQSLAQFLARELSQRIKRDETYFVEGAQLSSAAMTVMTFRHPDGRVISNSLISAGYDTSMFRLREK